MNYVKMAVQDRSKLKVFLLSYILLYYNSYNDINIDLVQALYLEREFRYQKFLPKAILTKQ